MGEQNTERGGAETSIIGATMSDVQSSAIGGAGSLLRVGQLSRLMGLAESSIRGQMRTGKFPMPYRKMGKGFVVRIDDYHDWYGSLGAERPKNGAVEKSDARQLGARVNASPPRGFEPKSNEDIAAQAKAAARQKMLAARSARAKSAP